MCGILGELAFSAPVSDEAIINRLIRMSHNRGPDAAGQVLVDERCRLAHNRLSILDLSAQANQPMQSPSGRYHVVYNGEVYNHHDLRDRLPRHFHAFRGNSDTETLAVAFDCWGIEPVIEQCDGMFALGVYDRKEQALWLARDFAGIKPLFYGQNPERIVFASQYDQIAAHPAFAGEAIDPAVLKLYFEQHFMPAPFGLLRNTGQLHPGEIMRIDGAGQTSRRRYWQMPTEGEPTIKSQKQALEFLKAELDGGVAAEMLSDVPLGAFLSGGIDSPLVCYFAQKHSTGRFKAFSIGSDSPVHDESADAAAYAGQMGLEHHLERMSATDAAAIMKEVASTLHEPMADFSIIPTYLVSRLARRDVKVALSGDGGDELFFGYERYWSIAKNIRWQALPYPVKYLAYGIDRVLGRNRHINSAVLAPTQGFAHRGLHSRFPASAIHSVAPELAQVGTPDAFDVYSYPLTQNLPRLLRHMRRAEFYGMMQKTLRKVDLASMENSLEVRVPFLKKSFIEAALQVDPFLSYGPGRKKQMLKDLLRRELPQSPIDNRKRGFSVPLGHWMRQSLKVPFADVVLEFRRHERFGLSSAAIEHIWHEHQNGARDHKWILFTLFSLFQWEANRTK